MFRRRYCRSAGWCRSSPRRSAAFRLAACRAARASRHRPARNNRSAEKPASTSDCLRLLEALRRLACRCGSRRAPRSSARGKATAPLPLVGRQVGVARRQREAVRLAHRRHADDLDREWPRSATMRRITASCWKSFSPNNGDVGPDRQQQLGDDRRDAVEMARPRLAFPALGHARRRGSCVAKPGG